MLDARDNQPKRTAHLEPPVPKTRRGPQLGVLVAFAVLAAAAGALGALSLDRPADRQSAEADTASDEASSSQKLAGSGPSRPSPTEALALVGRTHPELLPQNGGPLRHEARTVLALDEQTVLIAAAEGEEPLPNVFGSLGVFYLESTQNGHRVVGSWPSLTIGTPMGRAPDFEVSREFGRWPVLVVRARQVHAGIACELLQLVELGPSGPTASDPFVSAYDARGADGPSGRVWAGQIRDVVPDGGFTFETGSGGVPFVRTDGRYVPAAGVQSPHC